jgi:hypothetical protein
MVRRLLDAGAEIDLEDNLHHTTLYYILNKLQTSCGNTSSTAMDVARILLANGADALCEDSCRCPCSPNGCLPSALLIYSYNDLFPARVPVWSIALLNLLLEHRRPTEAKRILLSFIRKAKFDEMEMTHVCCGRYRGWCSARSFQEPISHEDVDEILNEESEYVEIMENEMALSSAKGYETLLDDWILQIKASLEKSREEAVECNRNLRWSGGQNQVLFTIFPFL